MPTNRAKPEFELFLWTIFGGAAEMAEEKHPKTFFQKGCKQHEKGLVTDMQPLRSSPAVQKPGIVFCAMEKCLREPLVSISLACFFRDPITLSEDDWGVQSYPQHGV